MVLLFHKKLVFRYQITKGYGLDTPLSRACSVTMGYLNSHSVSIRTLSSFSYKWAEVRNLPKWINGRLIRSISLRSKLSVASLHYVVIFLEVEIIDINQSFTRVESHGFLGIELLVYVSCISLFRTLISMHIIKYVCMIIYINVVY